MGTANTWRFGRCCFPHAFPWVALLLGVALSVPSTVWSQIQATDQQGRKILVYPDGTWKLVDSTAATAPPTAQHEPPARQAKPKEKQPAQPRDKDKTPAKRAKADLDVFGEALQLDTAGLAQKERDIVAEVALPSASDTAATAMTAPTDPAPILMAPPPATADRWKTPVAAQVLPHPGTSQPCRLVRDQVDEFTGKRLRTVAESYFFGHRRNDETEGGAKPSPKDDYLSVFSGLSQEGENCFLTVTFLLHSPYGRAEYGYIPERAPFQLMTVSGEVVALTAMSADRGRVVGDETHYRALFYLDPKIRKTLQSAEVDKVRFGWSGGSETYEVYDVDFVSRQLKCLFPK